MTFTRSILSAATADACKARAARLRLLLPGWTVALTGNGLRATLTTPDRHFASVDLINLRPIGCNGYPSVPALTEALRVAEARTYSGSGRPLLPGEVLVNGVRVEGETVRPSTASNGREPGLVEGCELVWLTRRECWHLCRPDDQRWEEAPYSAWLMGDGRAAGCSYKPCGASESVDEDFATLEAACRWIADRARADGYRVPTHPLRWDVGGGE